MIDYTIVEKILFGLLIVLVIVSIVIAFIPDMLLHLV